MREIKFRLRLHGKFVGYEKWYPGKYLEQSGVWEAHARWLYSKDGEQWNIDPIWHDTKDQFTGLRDKNGKDIYEGDVIRNRDGDCYEVKFEDGYFYPLVEIEQLTETWNIPESVEVIGNIYEHPELLKK